VTKYLYARTGGPPNNWYDLEVYVDGVKSKLLFIEVNVMQGWGIFYKKNKKGNFIQEGKEAATEKMQGKFELREKEP